MKEERKDPSRKKAFFVVGFIFIGSFLVAQMVKKLSAMQETWIRSLSQEDPLEKGMVTHSSILAWRTPWTEEPGGLQSMGLQRAGHDWATNTFVFIILLLTVSVMSFLLWTVVLPTLQKKLNEGKRQR